RPILASRAIVTAQLALGAAVVWLLIGIPLGTLSALRPRSRFDRAAMGFALVAVSMPVFLLGMGVLYLFWFKLHVVASAGYVSIGHGLWPWLRHMLVPWIVLALLFAAFYARMGRATLMEAMGEDFVRTARSKGLSESRVVLRHGLRMSVLPL